MSQHTTDTTVLEEIVVDGYEKIVVVSDEKSQLKAIIAIHNTTLGPALGGTRIYPYLNFESALTDVKRLAQGMTYKSALAGVGFGGGKSVILCHPKDKHPEMLLAFAKAVDRLQGLYTGAEDIGSSVEDVSFMAQHTPYFVGVRHPRSSGDPSPFTAWGTLRGIEAALQYRCGSSSVAHKTIAIQGLGNVGSRLAELLFWRGARLVVSDIDWDKAQRYAHLFGAIACPPEDLLSTHCDVLAPCAMGGIINRDTIPELQCSIIAGSANNQLLTSADAELLHQKGILYAPDFVINAGGLINVSLELEEVGYDPNTARIKVDAIYDNLLDIFKAAEKQHCSTEQAAVSIGDDRLRNGIGKRTKPPHYHRYHG